MSKRSSYLDSHTEKLLRSEDNSSNLLSESELNEKIQRISNLYQGLAGEEVKSGASNDVAESTDEYVRFFINVYEEMGIYKDSMYNDSDTKIMKQFLELAPSSQSLFVRLLKRRFKWIKADSINYNEVPNVHLAIIELVSTNLLNTSSLIPLCEDIQETYEFLYSLRIEHLTTLENHLRSQLSLFFDTDSVEIEVVNPWCSLLRYYSKFCAYKNFFAQLGEEVFEDTKSRKSSKVKAVIELLVYFNKNLLVDQNKMLEIVSPPDFSGFIKLNEQAVFLFSRVHHAYSHYFTENLLADFGASLGKNFTQVKYKTSAETYPIYRSYQESVESESAFGFKCLLENLAIRHYDQEICIKISKEIVKLRELDNINIDQFIEVYENVAEYDWKNQYTSDERWARLLNSCLVYLERSKDWNQSLQVLMYLLLRHNYVKKRGHWWERMIIILKSHLSRPKDAEFINALAIKDPFVRTGMRFNLESRLSTALSNASSLKFFDFLHDCYSEVRHSGSSIKIDGKLKFVHNFKALSVEEYAIEYYEEQGWRAYHSENSILPSLYGILMWDFIFDDSVPYAFQTSYQKAPLDLRSDDFLCKRQKSFNRCLALLTCPSETCRVFEKNYKEHFRQMSLLVNWDLLESMGIDYLISVIAGLDQSLIKILKVLSEDFSSYSSGMPDLILSNGSEVKFVEVKSTNDKLSAQQKVWIRLLATSGCKVEVLHIVHKEETSLPSCNSIH